MSWKVPEHIMYEYAETKRVTRSLGSVYDAVQMHRWYNQKRDGLQHAVELFVL